jgi:hypothetical protein
MVFLAVELSAETLTSSANADVLTGCELKFTPVTLAEFTVTAAELGVKA